MALDDLPADQAGWDAVHYLEALGFHDTGARLGPHPATGRLRVSDNSADYQDSCGLYAWVYGRDVYYFGITDSCLRARNYKHAQGGAPSDMLLQSGLTVDVWFLEEPATRFETATLVTRTGRSIQISPPDILLLERFLITLGRDCRWDLFNIR